VSKLPTPAQLEAAGLYDPAAPDAAATLCTPRAHRSSPGSRTRSRSSRCRLGERGDPAP